MGEVSIMSLKFSTAGAEKMSSALEAIDYAIEQGADIMSNSTGGSAESVLYDLLKIASEKGISIINAAGNSGNDSDRFPIYPASYDILDLSVLDDNGRNKGKLFKLWETMVDVFAQKNEHIYSTWFAGGYKSLEHLWRPQPQPS